MVKVTVYPRANLARGRAPQLELELAERTPLARIPELLGIEPAEVMGFAVNGVMREPTDFPADGDTVEILPAIAGG